MKIISGVPELASHVGQILGVSEWFVIDRERTDAFAAALSRDGQSRMASDPGRPPVSNEFLTLSLLPRLVSRAFVVERVGVRVNYGLGRVRFLRSLQSGDRIRDSIRLAAAEWTTNGLRATLRHTVEISGAVQPACVADTITLYSEKESK